MSREYIYKDRDNIISVELLENGVNLSQVQYDAISRMTLEFDDIVIDSDVVGEGSGKPFDWISNRRLDLMLGSSLSDVIVEHYPNVKHIIYSPNNPNGLVWGYLDIVVL